MEPTFTASTKSGDIVSKFPMAGKILKKYHIDFCCTGQRPIGDALEDKHLNQKKTLEEINVLFEETRGVLDKETDWMKEDYAVLIDHIANVHNP